MRLSPLLLGFAALGFGWASPVLAQDGTDCGLLCQIGGYLSTDHMTASPGDAAAGAGAPAKAHKAHAARKPSARPATQDVAHGAPPAAAHVAAKTVPAAATPAKSVATGPGDAAPGIRKAVVAKGESGKAEGGKAVLANAAVGPEVRTPGHGGAKAPVATADRTSTPREAGRKTAAKITETTAVKSAAKPTARPAVVAATATRRAPVTPPAVTAEIATPTPDRGRAARKADRAGGSVEIASASATPSPSTAAVPAKPVHTARAALPRRTPGSAPAQADRPVIVLTALAAIPGSAPAISAGFQPAAATAR